MVEKVKCLKANLEVALTIQVNGAEDAPIEDRLSGSTELISTGIRQNQRGHVRRGHACSVGGLGYALEGSWIEPGLSS